MKSERLGRRTSTPEVTNISTHGFWVLIGGHEKFVAFNHFPWFRDVSIRELLHVRLPHAGHLYWPELDVDLAIESIDHPERYPLVSRARPRKRVKPLAGRRKGNRTRAGERLGRG
jgi:hypothetical protein